MTTLRRFMAADAPACAALINTAIETMDGLNAAARALVVAKNASGVLATELAECFTMVATDEGGELEGVAALTGAEIKRVYVRPQSQRRGTGRLLVRALEDEARRRGITRLELQASRSSVPFYTALGFSTLGENTSRTGEAVFHHVGMEKRLG